MEGRVTIVGLGCVGASIGLALRGQDPPLEVVGHDKEPDHARQAIEKRALARAVRPDNGAHFVALNLEIDLRQRRQPAESDGQQFGPEDRSRPGSPVFVRGAGARREFGTHLR